MKIRNWIAVLSILMVAASGCVNTRQSGENKATLEGTAHLMRVDKISLYDPINGENKELANMLLDKDGNFGFVIAPEEEGFYSLGKNHYYYDVYVKPGDHIELKLNDDKGIELVGEGSPENTYLSAWQQIIHPLKEIVVTPQKSPETFSATFKTVFPLIEEIAAKAEAFKETINSGNDKFDRLMKLKVDFDLEHFTIRFLRSPRTAHPSIDDYTAYIEQIMKGNSSIQNADVLNVGSSKLIISMQVDMRAGYDGRLEEYKSLATRLKLADSYLGNDTVAGIYFSWHLPYFKTLMELESAFEGVDLKRIPVIYQKAIQERMNELRSVASGSEAMDFTLEDVDGKKVSLSDFKGKVVVMDFWATWCAPCKQQIPFFEELQKNMAGQDVVFMGVSVDTDKAAWKKMVRSKELSGVQLYNNGWKDAATMYKVNAVPRYVVIDKEGVIVSLQAPTPSTGRLKGMIEKLL